MWRDWEAVNTFGNIASITAGGTPARGVSQYWNGQIPWITPTEITALSGKKHLTTFAERISPEGLANSSAKLIAPYSLLVTTRATLGLRAINIQPVTTNQGFKSLTFDKDFDPTFYYHLMPLLQRDLEARASGTTFLEISGKEFSRTVVPTPTYEEQKAIAEILDTADEAIAATQAMLDKQDKIKDGLLQDLLTRGVDENGHLRPSYKNAPDLYKPSSLGFVPKEWDVIQLENSSINIIDGDRGEHYPSAHELLDDGYCIFLNASNVTKQGFVFDAVDYISKEKDQKLRKGKLVRDDIVLTTRGTVGNFAYYTETVAGDHLRINSGMIIFRNNEKDLDTKFF